MAKILVFPDGTEIPVIADDGRYWVTESARYSKTNKDFLVKRAPNVAEDHADGKKKSKEKK